MEDIRLQFLGATSMLVKVIWQEQGRTLQFLVVEGNGPNLLDRDGLTQLQLDWNQVYRLTSPAEEMLSKYKEVSDDQLKSYTGQPGTIFVEPRAVPQYYKARSVPYMH